MCVADVPRKCSAKLRSDWLRESVFLSVWSMFFSRISIAVCSIFLRFCMCVAEVPRISSIKFRSDWLKESVLLSVWVVCFFPVSR